MILPPGNTLDLSTDTLVLDTSTHPLLSDEDALALFPEWVRELDDAPVRDALAAALRATFAALWSRAHATIAQEQSPRFASGAWLAEWGRRRQLPQAPGETEGDYRARLLRAPSVVTPSAVVSAVLALCPTARCFEPATDGAFWSDGSDVVAYWQCDESLPNAARLGNDDSSAPVRIPAYWGSLTSQSAPEFWIALPASFDALGDTLAFAETSDVLAPEFWTDSTLDGSTDETFVGVAQVGFDVLVSDVDARRAYGVPWFAFVDPLLDTVNE